jgi:hypothetical protein
MHFAMTIWLRVKLCLSYHLYTISSLRDSRFKNSRLWHYSTRRHKEPESEFFKGKSATPAKSEMLVSINGRLFSIYFRTYTDYGFCCSIFPQLDFDSDITRDIGTPGQRRLSKYDRDTPRLIYSGESLLTAESYFRKHLKKSPFL